MIHNQFFCLKESVCVFMLVENGLALWLVFISVVFLSLALLTSSFFHRIYVLKHWLNLAVKKNQRRTIVFG